MEYILQLEQAQRYHILCALIGFALFLMVLSHHLFGIFGLLAWIAILISLIITPLLIDRYKFFIYLWFFGLPIGLVGYNFLNVVVEDKNPIVFLIMALSGPFAVILFCRDYFKIAKDCPFIKFLVFFCILLLVNLFRPGVNILDILSKLKFIGFGIFIIMCSYFYFKNNDWKKLVDIFAVWILINCIAAIFQKVTGIGIMMLDGYPRIPGLLHHPNGLSGCIVIYFAMFSYLIRTIKSKKLKYFHITVAFFGIIGLLLALSKTALLGFGIVCIFMFAELSKKNKVKALVAIPIILISFLLIDNIFNWGIVNVAVSRMFNDQVSYHWRLKMWNDVISMLNFKTVILGAGPEAFAGDLLALNNGVISMHNGFLELISYYGILGLSYLGFYVYFIVYAVKGLINKPTPEIRNLLKLIFILSFFMVMKICLDQTIWSRPVIYPIFFFITFAYLEVKNFYNKNKLAI